MTSTKYIGMDVHKESISIAVRNNAGKIVMECVIESKANIILDFIHGLRGELQVTFEEGTWATWLYDLLKPHVAKLVVCDPRKNARQGNKNDRIDASELADRLYMNKLSSVYHGGAGVRTLRELARSYLTISKDLARVMSRVKAIYRSWGIPCAGKQVYAPRHRAEWLAKITEVGVHRRAEFYYQQLDALRPLRHEVRTRTYGDVTGTAGDRLPMLIPPDPVTYSVAFPCYDWTEFRARLAVYLPRRSHAHRLRLPAERHARLRAHAVGHARAAEAKMLAYTAERIEEGARFPWEFTAVTDVPLGDSDRHRFVREALRKAGIEPVPREGFAVWVAKLQPMLQ